MPATQKWDMKSRIDERRERKAAEESHWRDVCRVVDKRDAGHCRVCGRRTDPYATDMLRRGEHHHLVYRSAGGVDENWNVVLLCLSCHRAEHDGKIEIRGNADTGIEVWRRHAETGEFYLSIREASLGVRERD